MIGSLQEYEQPAGRPVFITILCILTFIGSTFGLVSGINTYSTADTQAAMAATMKERINDKLQKDDRADPGSAFAHKIINSVSLSPATIKKGAIANMSAAILCLLGAFMMWKLRKTGFYLYVAGTLIGIISPFLIFGSNNILSIGSSLVIGFFGLVFIILYGVNLKHMK